jgi:hypothetical protein
LAFNQSSDEEIHPMVSATPLSLSPHISSLLAKERTSTGSSEAKSGEEEVTIERIKVNSEGNLLAVSLRHRGLQSDSSSGVATTLPFVGLFLFSSRPHLSLCLLRSAHPSSLSHPSTEL